MNKKKTTTKKEVDINIRPCISPVKSNNKTEALSDDNITSNVPPISLTNVPGVSLLNVPPVSHTNVPEK